MKCLWWAQVLSPFRAYFQTSSGKRFFSSLKSCLWYEISFFYAVQIKEWREKCILSGLMMKTLFGSSPITNWVRRRISCIWLKWPSWDIIAILLCLQIINFPLFSPTLAMNRFDQNVEHLFAICRNLLANKTAKKKLKLFISTQEWVFARKIINVLLPKR